VSFDSFGLRLFPDTFDVFANFWPGKGKEILDKHTGNLEVPQ